MLDYQPGFEPEVRWLHLARSPSRAAGCSGRPRVKHGHAIMRWACGITLCWGLIMTLWLPYLDAGKSYRTMLRSIARELPGDGCVASLYFGEGQRGLLVYFENLTTMRLERVPDAPCNTLLVRGGGLGATAPSDKWISVREGAPSDQSEFYAFIERTSTRTS